MDLTIYPGKLSGTIEAIPSKSQAHRLMILSAFADRETVLFCKQTNQDIEATAQCLNALGASVTRTAVGYIIRPVSALPANAVLPCGESGSTLRFMLPVAGALGVDATFVLEGRLPQRPLSPLWEEMERMGCLLTRPTENTVRCQGKLHSGAYQISGSISSQFITGLYFALSLIPGDNKLCITGQIESKPYISMTKLALEKFGVHIEGDTVYGRVPFSSPGSVNVEGDWSNAAFFLGANQLGSRVNVLGLDPESPQGDRVCQDIFLACSEKMKVSAAQIPDLIPILAVVAGGKKGGVFYDAARLRLKESDRIESTAKMLRAFGANVITQHDSLLVEPAIYQGCTVDSAGDHRIAMAAAIAATAAQGPVTILGTHCVAKSYPSFWEEYKKLGGNYVEHIR